MARHRIQQQNYKTTNTNHIKKWYHTAVLLGVNRLKELPITINKTPLDEPINQSKATTQNSASCLKWTTQSKIRNKNREKTRMLSHSTKSQTVTIPLTTRREKRIKTTNRIRTPWETRDTWRRLFCITRSNYGKEGQNSKNCACCP